ILAVDVGALDGTVVQVGNTHVGPVDVPCLDIDDDAVREMAARPDGLAVRAIGVHDVDASGIQLENEETTDHATRDRASGRFHDSFRHLAPSWLPDADSVRARP